MGYKEGIVLLLEDFISFFGINGGNGEVEVIVVLIFR